MHFLVCDLMAIRLQPFPMVRPSLGPTIANGCSPVGARSQAFFSFLSALKAQELTLECYKHLMTVKSLFIECGRKYKFLTCLKKRKKNCYISHSFVSLCSFWNSACSSYPCLFPLAKVYSFFRIHFKYHLISENFLGLHLSNINKHLTL